MIKLGELVMILDLHQQGLSVSAIARQLCVDRKTVRSAIAKGLEPPKYKTRAPQPRIIKVAARIVEMKTMIRVHLPASCPAQDILRLVLGRIPRLVT